MSSSHEPTNRPDPGGQWRDQPGSVVGQSAPTPWPGQPGQPAERTPVAEGAPSYTPYSANAPTGPDPAAYTPQAPDTGEADTRGYDPTAYHPPAYGSGAAADAGDATAQPVDSAAVRAREKEAFGGVKVGSAFFGWLTAVGATVILVALVAAVASALDLGSVVDGSRTSQNLRHVGSGAAIAVLVVLFVAYYCGGFVAGRMARFNGVRQGVAVWLWSVLIAAALTGLGLLADSNSTLTSDFNLPNVPVDSGKVTQTSLIALAVVLAVTLVGAIVGGLAGMRFHRRVDRAGFASDPV